MSGTATTVPNTTQQQQPQQTPVPVDVTQQQQQQQPAATTTTATAAPTGLAAAAQSHILQHVNAQEQQQGLDYNSVLEQIQSLQKQNADLQAQLTTSNQHLSKFREGKSAEMKELMETTIAKYLEQLNSLDQGSKENLKNNLEQLAKEGNATGVWEVMACASSNWAANVNQIETLTQQVNSYQEKERQLRGGLFHNESSRVIPNSGAQGIPGVGKRSIDEVSGHVPYTREGDGGTSVGGGFYDEFERMIMQNGGNCGENLAFGHSAPVAANVPAGSFVVNPDLTGVL